MPARILIVEDEETLRESLKRVLTKDGYNVDAVESSEAALATIEICSYHVVITDIILPGISGLELLFSYAASAFFAFLAAAAAKTSCALNVPSIACTGHFAVQIPQPIHLSLSI